MKLKQKIEIYERVLHALYTASSVTMDHEKVNKLLTNIGNWSYAHRQGNGEFSIKEQQKLVENAFNKLME